jgi:hypothetical protein
MFKLKRTSSEQPNFMQAALNAEDMALRMVGAVAENVVKTVDEPDSVWHQAALKQLADAVENLNAAREMMRASLRVKA